MEEKKEYHFGEKIRQVREKKHMTLKAVAQAAGVSESLVSQIERNKVSPAIDTLLDLANALDISLDYLFEEYSRRRPVSITHRDERRTLNEEDVVYSELSDSYSANGENSFESYTVVIPEGSKTHRGNYGHIGQEMGLVTRGTGILHYGDKQYTLKAGDSITFSANAPHNIENTGSEPFEAIWIVTPAQKFNSN
ncbi:MAG: XRE family transcriptional regulator [Treponema sp.]|nr:XRE family transcriptional regulator [Treponema sp.]